MRIAIIGAGTVGSALGFRLAPLGEDVHFGVRAGSDASGAIARSGGKAIAHGLREAAAGADLVFLTVPAAAALDAAREAAPPQGAVLIDCTNPVEWKDGPVLVPPAAGSVAAALVDVLPGVHVVKAFNMFGAEIHADPGLSGRAAQVPMAGDDGAAKALVAALARRAGFEPIDAGPLRNAALLEAMAVLWIHLAIKGGRGRDWAFLATDRQAVG